MEAVDLLIVWDIENVRVPAELRIADVMAALRRVFVRRRRCAGVYAAVSLGSMRAIGDAAISQVVKNRDLSVRMLLAAHGHGKADSTDSLLIEVMQSFAVGCALSARQGVILLISGDCDFVRPAMLCMAQGCRLESLYHEQNASAEIKRLSADWSMDWSQFLRRELAWHGPLTFNYPAAPAPPKAVQARKPVQARKAAPPAPKPVQAPVAAPAPKPVQTPIAAPAPKAVRAPVAALIDFDEPLIVLEHPDLSTPPKDPFALDRPRVLSLDRLVTAVAVFMLHIVMS